MNEKHNEWREEKRRDDRLVEEARAVVSVVAEEGSEADVVDVARDNVLDAGVEVDADAAKLLLIMI